MSDNTFQTFFASSSSGKAKIRWGQPSTVTATKIHSNGEVVHMETTSSGTVTADATAGPSVSPITPIRPIAPFEPMSFFKPMTSDRLSSTPRSSLPKKRTPSRAPACASRRYSSSSSSSSTATSIPRHKNTHRVNKPKSYDQRTSYTRLANPGFWRGVFNDGLKIACLGAAGVGVFLWLAAVFEFDEQGRSTAKDLSRWDETVKGLMVSVHNTFDPVNGTAGRLLGDVVESCGEMVNGVCLDGPPSLEAGGRINY
ncbi:hypothetical protein NX059_011680 [Plenodomus lindquistii]|nr:hypothetical protein NX059_011680 [Plenodomus lindquistii]